MDMLGADALVPSLADLALAAALAWTAGLRPYLAALVAGLAARAGGIDLPAALAPLAHPAVLGTAAVLSMVEWRVSRMHGLDCLWDVLHTPIRIPAGTAMAVLALSPQPYALALAAGAAGAALATTAHVGKSVVRALMSADPLARPPRRALSLAEELATLALVGVALASPALGLAGVVLSFGACAWIMPRLLRRLARIRRELLDLLSPLATTSPR